jgi:hypothetical protein
VAQAIGRSRGGLTTKVHLLAEGRGRSLVKRLTAGQAADTKELVALLDAVAVPRPGGVGRHRRRDPGQSPLGPDRRQTARREQLEVTEIVAEFSDVDVPVRRGATVRRGHGAAPSRAQLQYQAMPVSLEAAGRDAS